MLNKIWVSFFLIAVVTASVKLFGYHDLQMYKKLTDALFEAGKTGFEVALGLTGAMCIWLGIMRVGEAGGAVNMLSKAISPLFSRLFPEIPKNHPAVGAIMMNFSANMLGLDNAATPLGLKAMKELQTINPEPEKASNAQIMFLVLNTSGLTIIPVSVLATMAAQGSTNPTVVFLPILMATFCSTLVGLIVVAIRQRINLFHPVVLAYVGGMIAILGGLLVYLNYHPEHTEIVSNVGGNGIILGIIALFFILALRKRIDLYSEFITGAKEGFQVAVQVIPYLITMLFAIALFRASGALESLLDGLRWFFIWIGLTYTEFVDALPVAFMKPLSGNGARSVMIDIFNQFETDSFRGRMAATMQGSTETTFYVLAVYFGSVNITKTRYALGAGLLADLAGILAAILLSYYFFPIN